MGTKKKSTKMEIVEINSIAEFSKQIEIIIKKKSYFDIVVWRGQGDVQYNLAPKLYRNNHWLSNEFEMVEEVKRRNPEDFTACKNRLDELTICQHYGLPTRLLDVTQNPLVALYFACSTDLKKDGEIIFFIDHPLKHWDIRVKCLTYFSTIFNYLKIDLVYKEFKEKFGYEHDTIKMIEDDLTKIHIVSPTLNNKRILAQQGAFLLFGVNKEKDKFIKRSNNIDDSVYERNKLKIIVPSSQKEQLLKELTYYGISKATLFPEIEYQCEEVSMLFNS